MILIWQIGKKVNTIYQVLIINTSINFCSNVWSIKYNNSVWVATVGLHGRMIIEMSDTSNTKSWIMRTLSVKYM